MDVANSHILAVLLSICSVCTAFGQQVRQPTSLHTGDSERVIVLADGQIVTGAITPRPDGYDVSLPAGRMFIPSQRVRFEADNMDDAYLKMRSSFSELVPETHIGIARWCINHKQWGFARKELLDALHLDPNRSDASRLLSYVERESGRLPGKLAPDRSGVTVMPSTSDSSGAIPERYSLGGLSTKTAQRFVRDVQPLLANKCANAACHGKGRNSFELIIPRYGSTPTIAERNLAAVMRFVSPEAPRDSKLLRIGAAQHGPLATSVFSGRTGGKQARVLHDWVHSVASELAPSMAYSAAPARDSSTGVESGIVQAGYEVENPAAMSANNNVPHGRVMNRGETDANALRDVEYRGRNDPFDPAAFNNLKRQRKQNQ